MAVFQNSSTLVTLQPFDETDWMGLSGAESFANDGSPLVSYEVLVDGLETCTVFDARGLAIQVLTPDGEEVAIASLPISEAVAFVARGLRAVYSTGELIDAGFTVDRND